MEMRDNAQAAFVAACQGEASSEIPKRCEGWFLLNEKVPSRAGPPNTIPEKFDFTNGQAGRLRCFRQYFLSDYVETTCGDCSARKPYLS